MMRVLSRSLWDFIHPHLSHNLVFTLALIFARVAMVVVDLLAPFLTQVAIDQLYRPDQGGATTLSTESGSGGYCGIAAVFC